MDSETALFGPIMVIHRYRNLVHASMATRVLLKEVHCADLNTTHRSVQTESA